MPADGDQTSGERDQTSADSDQAASDSDQAASDRDLAHGVDPREQEASREIARRPGASRPPRNALRARTSATLAALARDRAAAARDLAMAQRDADYEHDDARAVTGAEVIMRAAEQRKRAR